MYDLRQLFRFIFGAGAILCYGGRGIGSGRFACRRLPDRLRAALFSMSGKIRSFDAPQVGDSRAVRTGSQMDPRRAMDSVCLCRFRYELKNLNESLKVTT